MPSSVAVNYLGDPQIETTLRTRIERFMEPYGGPWLIQIIGSERNPIWEMTIKGPDGKSRWIIKWYGKNWDHAIDKILADIRKIICSSFSMSRPKRAPENGRMIERQTR